MPEEYDIPLEGAAMPACLPRAHRPALVLWLLGFCEQRPKSLDV